VAGLLDHLIGHEEQGWGHREAQRLSGLEVENQLVLRGLLHGQVSGLGALENLVHVRCAALPAVRLIGINISSLEM
jgi:hypothetical protein